MVGRIIIDDSQSTNPVSRRNGRQFAQGSNVPWDSKEDSFPRGKSPSLINGDRRRRPKPIDLRNAMEAQGRCMIRFPANQPPNPGDTFFARLLAPPIAATDSSRSSQLTPHRSIEKSVGRSQGGSVSIVDRESAAWYAARGGLPIFHLGGDVAIGRLGFTLEDLNEGARRL
jgi:hypothetical protein